jgi:glycosyltransferase involved in cell wall biosynthesis
VITNTSRPRVAFVSNFAQYYRVPLFEALAREFNIDFLFFSRGKEGYWLSQQGVSYGNFKSIELPGVRVWGTSIAPTLATRLWRGDYDVYISGIVGRFALPATFAVARMRRRPFILWSNIWMRIQTPVHRAFFPLTRFFYRHADAIVAGGEHIKRYLESEGADGGRIFSCDNATDNEFYARHVSEAQRTALRERLNVRQGDKIILYLGRLEEAKGLHVLLEAFASLHRSDAVLVFAGVGSDGLYRTRLELQARDLGIAERVRFGGFVPRAETPGWYSLAWVYVLPSITTATFKEPWGLVVNEAFSQGTPVIATDAVGAVGGGMLRHDVEGLVVPERNPQELARAIARVLDNESLRHQLGNAGRRRIDQWTVARMVDGFRQAIELSLCRR